MNSNNIIYFLLVVIIILLLILIPRPYDINNINDNNHINTNKKYVIPIWHYPAYWTNPYYRRTLVIKTNVNKSDNHSQDRKIKRLENNMSNIINNLENSNIKNNGPETNIISTNTVDTQGNLGQNINLQTTYEDTVSDSQLSQSMMQNS